MEEKELKEMLAASKMKADERLKDRIIHQINAENSLIPKKQKTIKSTGNHFYIFGIMYFLLLTLVAYFYYQTDGNPFHSQTFIIATILVASTFNLYWLIIVYGDYKKIRQ